MGVVSIAWCDGRVSWPRWHCVINANVGLAMAVLTPRNVMVVCGAAWRAMDRSGCVKAAQVHHHHGPAQRQLFAYPTREEACLKARETPVVKAPIPWERLWEAAAEEQSRPPESP